VIANVRLSVLLGGRTAAPVPVSLWTAVARLMATGYFYWEDEVEARPPSETLDALLEPLQTELGFQRTAAPPNDAVAVTAQLKGETWPGWLRMSASRRHPLGTPSLVLEAVVLPVPPESDAQMLARAQALATALEQLCRKHLSMDRSGTEVSLTPPVARAQDSTGDAWFSTLLADASPQPAADLHAPSADGGGDLNAIHHPHDVGGGQL
jgi:hypothetical protein